MKKYILSGRAAFLLILQLAFFLNIRANPRIPNDTSAPERQNLDYIDPTIGNVGQLLEPTRPTAHLPNQLIRFTPQRNDYLDDQISSFPLTIVSHRLGQVFSIKPSLKKPGMDAWESKMSYDNNLEVNRPWYYST